MPMETLGKYELLKVLGHGAAGIVYQAKDTLLSRQVALKVIDVQKGDRQRFLDGARILNRLSHPNIVRVHSVDEIDGRVVIDMERVVGRNLQEKLRDEGRLSIEKSLTIAIQILDALDHAHALRAVHRDIKPANILITQEGEVKIVDFELAEILATNVYAGGAGTYAYMAPEDYAEEDRSDHQSDLWAVGVTLFEMLTGNRPFHTDQIKNPFAWKRVLEKEPPRPLANYLPRPAAELQAILDRALAKEKTDRYQTAAAFRDDLLRFLESGSVAPETEAAGERLSAWREESWQDDDEETRTQATPLKRGGLGVTVARALPADSAPQPIEDTPDLEAKEKPLAPRKGIFSKREVVPTMRVEPEIADFGAIRKGEMRSLKIKVRVKGAPRGKVIGSVTQKPDWLTVHPRAFEQARQTLTLTALTSRVWEKGVFEDVLTVVTEAGETHIPLRMQTLAARPSFGEIAYWYVPLLGASLLPAIMVAIASGSAVSFAWLIPPAALSSGIFALMLLTVCVGASTGIGERLVCGLLAAVMAITLGATVAAPHSEYFGHGVSHTWIVGALLGGVWLIQLGTAARWKFWAFAHFCLSVGAGATALHILQR